MDLRNIPVADDSQVFIYIMRNSDGKIKIGKTKNIYKRYLSLCGSNSGGVPITDVYCSPATYLESLETTMHTKFSKYRIPRTEWFYGLNFSDVVKELELIINSESYIRCNELRSKIDGRH